MIPGLEDEDSRAKQLAEALHTLQRSQAVGESGIEALHAEGDVHELDNTIVGADATIKAWRFMQVCCLYSSDSDTVCQPKLGMHGASQSSPDRRLLSNTIMARLVQVLNVGHGSIIPDAACGACALVLEDTIWTI